MLEQGDKPEGSPGRLRARRLFVVGDKDVHLLVSVGLGVVGKDAVSAVRRGHGLALPRPLEVLRSHEICGEKT